MAMPSRNTTQAAQRRGPDPLILSPRPCGSYSAVRSNRAGTNQVWFRSERLARLPLWQLLLRPRSAWDGIGRCHLKLSCDTEPQSMTSLPLTGSWPRAAIVFSAFGRRTLDTGRNRSNDLCRLLFGTLVGLPWSASAGATIAFLIARRAFGEFLTRHAGVLAAKLTREFCRDAFAYLLFLRIAPSLPFWLVNVSPLCVASAL
jgi:hypothetical protein